ncbi:hypothetical protein LP420_37860 [Massilia sp. B-10]|nr:hypothetical protein LP420_37860 [Massilia sp. B-10]
MVGALAIDTYLPSIPAIGREFEVGPLAVQQTLSVFLFCFAFMMLFYGTLSDSFGRLARDPGRAVGLHPRFPGRRVRAHLRHAAGLPRAAGPGGRGLAP